jgi:cobalt/nickel transport system permease protein
MYRYFFVLVDELEKMLRAVKLRSFKNNRFKTFSILANIVGVLFIRSYERSERVYNAMSMRGFDGEIKKL